jgi:hypothetical protein
MKKQNFNYDRHYLLISILIAKNRMFTITHQIEYQKINKISINEE